MPPMVAATGMYVTLWVPVPEGRALSQLKVRTERYQKMLSLAPGADCARSSAAITSRTGNHFVGEVWAEAWDALGVDIIARDIFKGQTTVYCINCFQISNSIFISLAHYCCLFQGSLTVMPSIRAKSASVRILCA